MKKIKTILVHGDGSIVAVDDKEQAVTDILSIESLLALGFATKGFEVDGTVLLFGKHSSVIAKKEDGSYTTKDYTWSKPQDEPPTEKKKNKKPFAPHELNKEKYQVKEKPEEKEEEPPPEQPKKQRKEKTK